MPMDLYTYTSGLREGVNQGVGFLFLFYIIYTYIYFYVLITSPYFGRAMHSKSKYPFYAH